MKRLSCCNRGVISLINVIVFRSSDCVWTLGSVVNRSKGDWIGWRGHHSYCQYSLPVIVNQQPELTWGSHLGAQMVRSKKVNLFTRVGCLISACCCCCCRFSGYAAAHTGPMTGTWTSTSTAPTGIPVESAVAFPSHVASKTLQWVALQTTVHNHLSI